LKVADRAGSGSRPIADPQILLGGMNRVVLAAHSPPGTAVLKEADLAAIRSLKISLDDVIDMDVAVNKNGLPPKTLPTVGLKLMARINTARNC
jgi:hypothetical protein